MVVFHGKNCMYWGWDINAYHTQGSETAVTGNSTQTRLIREMAPLLSSLCLAGAVWKHLELSLSSSLFTVFSCCSASLSSSPPPLAALAPWLQDVLTQLLG